MPRASFAFIITSVVVAAPAAAQDIKLYVQQSVPNKPVGKNLAPAEPATPPNANAEAFNSKVDALFENQANGLTADQAAQRATETSFQVKQQRETLQSNEALKSQAKWAFIPPIQFNASYLRVRQLTAHLNTPQGPVYNGAPNPAVLPTDNQGTPADLHTPAGGISIAYLPRQITVGAQITVPLTSYFFSLPQQLAAANRNIDAARYTERNQELTTRTDAKVAYYEWVRAKLQQIVQEQALAQAQAQAKDARAQFEAGASTRADVLRLESQVATVQLDLERAKNAAALAEETLRRQMHDTTKQEYAIGEDIREDLPELDNVSDVNALWLEAEDKRLDLKAYTMQAEATEERAKAQRVSNYPTVNGIATFTENNPLQQIIPQQAKWGYYWTAGVQATWVPTNIFSNQGQVHSLEAQSRSYTAQRDYARDQLHVNVMNAVQSLHVAEVALDTTQHALESSEESFRVRRALFQNGRATTVEVIDSETDLTRAREAAVNARIDLRIARARLINQLGRDTDQAM